MKALALLFTAICLLATSASGQVGQNAIRIAVELLQKAKTDPKQQWDKTQTRSLKITVFNNSANAMDGLEVKYWFTGHTAGEHEQKVIREGSRKSSLTPRGKDPVDSEEVTTHFAEEHYPPSKGGKGGGGAAKKIPATGDKLTGYAVRVMAGDKIMAEYYSEPSVKTIVDKGGAAPAAPAPAAKPAAKK